MRVLVTGARAPACLEWARLLSAAGWAVAVADSMTVPLARFSSAAQRYFELPPPAASVGRYAERLARAAGEFGAELIIPTCEEAFYISHQKSFLERTCPVFAADFALMEMLHDKGRFASFSARLPIRAPETERIVSFGGLGKYRGDASAFVFKPVFSRFASRTLIRPHPSALGGMRPTSRHPWIAQRYVAGEELCSFSILRDGKVLAHACYRPQYRVGQASGIYFQPGNPRAIREFVEAFGEATRYTGQVGFDFIDAGERGMFVLECNPRATSGIHLLSGKAFEVAGSILGERDAPAVEGAASPRMVAFAMMLFAAPKLREVSGWRAFIRAWTEASDVISVPGDRWPLPGQLAAFGEILARAALRRRPLLSAATEDIEWDGDDLGPVAV